MKVSMRVDTLEGALLDYWVAKAEGYTEPNLHKLSSGWVHIKSKGMVFGPSSNWSQAGPIIERERISLFRNSRGTWEAFKDAWHSYNGLEGDHEQEGQTALIASMRCYVASKYGEEVPDQESL